MLHGLTSASGAMVAAATTSLPERLEGGRNYDYRYAWIRDQCYAGLAVAAHGPHPLLAGLVRFVTERLLDDGPGLMPAYTVAGEADRRRGAAAAARLPRRCGAGRATGYAASSSSTRSASRCRCSPPRRGHDMLTTDDWRAAAVAADVIDKRWREPDAGIWELDDRRWTHSRLACVSGLRAIAAAAGAPGRLAGTGTARRPGGAALADAIAASLSDAVHPTAGGSGHQTTSGWTRPCCSRSSGAGSPADDPRNLATIEAVRRELAADGFVYRFRHDDRPLHKAEGAFLLCGFWMALVEHALRQPGRRGALVRAEPERLRARRPVHRGVRRAPAAAAGQPAAGVRARRDA